MRRALVALAGLSLFACDPDRSRPLVAASPATCAPAAESDSAHELVIVGTIGKLHMVQKDYPLSKLGDVMSSFKPDLVLLAIRPDAYREGNYEDASFEMTYLAALAKNRAIVTEGIDWFRASELASPPPPLEPNEDAEAAKRDAEVLAKPKLLSFEQANDPALAESVFLATTSEQRRRGGWPAFARRSAWIQQLAIDAVTKNKKPRRVLAYVDVLDRPSVTIGLGAIGYEPRDPAQVIKGASEVMVSDLPPEVLSQYKNQLGRVRDRIEKAKGPDKSFWQEKERVLEIVVDKRAACCVEEKAFQRK